MKRNIIITIILILFISAFVFAESSINPLTRGFADQLYCFIDGSNCALGGGGGGGSVSKIGATPELYNNSDTIYLNTTTRNQTINASIDLRVSISFLQNLLDSIYTTFSDIVAQFDQELNTTSDVSFNSINADMGWTNLTDYPSACPSESYFKQIGDIIICEESPRNTTQEIHNAIDNTTWARNITFRDYLPLTGGTLSGNINLSHPFASKFYYANKGAITTYMGVTGSTALMGSLSDNDYVLVREGATKMRIETLEVETLVDLRVGLGKDIYVEGNICDSTGLCKSTEKIVRLENKTISKMIYAPDFINDDIPIYHTPIAINITYIEFTLPSDATYNLVFEEWSGSPPSLQNNLESMTTCSTCSYNITYQDEMDDFELDAGDYLFLDVPGTDVDWIHIQFGYVEAD